MAEYLPPVVGRLTGDSSDFTSKVRGAKSDVDDLDRHSRTAGTSGNTAMANIGDGATRAHGGVGLLRTGIAGLAGGLLAIGGTAVFGGFLREATEAQKVGSQTDAVIKSTGGSANVTAGQVDALANSISRKTGIDDEQIATSANMLLTFTNIRNEVGAGNDIFSQATRTATDMAVALGEDGSAAAMQLGKALNDPIQGVTALRRVGVQLSDQQQEQVKAMVASGDQMGAQKVILAELTKEFGGSAAAQATAGDKIKVTFKNLQETIGTALMPVIETILPAFQTAVDALAPALGPIGTLVAGIVTAIAPAIPPLIPIVTALATVFGQVLSALTPLIPPVLSLITAFSPLVPMIGTLVATIVSALVPVLGTIITAMVPVVTTIVSALQPVMVQLQPVIKELAGAFLQVVVALLPLLPPIAQLVVAFIPLIPLIVQFMTLGMRLLPVLMPIVTVLVELASILIGGLAEGVTAVVGLFTDFDGTLRGIEDAAGAVWSFFEALPGKLLGLVAGAAGWLVDVGGQIIDGLVSGVESAAPAVLQFFLDLPGNILAILVGAPVLLLVVGLNLITGLVNGIVAAVPAVWNFFTSLPGNIWNLLTGAGTWLVNTGADLIVGLINGINSITGQVWGWFQELPGRLWDIMSNAPEWLLSVGENIIHGLMSGINNIAGEVWGFFGGMLGRIYETLGRTWEWLISVGENIVNGLVDGIRRVWHKVEDTIGELADHLPGVVKDVLGIGSPSRVFAGLGVNIGEGLALGVERSMPLVLTAVDKVSDATIARMTQAQRAAVSAAQAFGESNISASGGYHAFTDPDGSQYYAPTPHPGGHLTLSPAAAPHPLRPGDPLPPGLSWTNTPDGRWHEDNGDTAIHGRGYEAFSSTRGALGAGGHSTTTVYLASGAIRINGSDKSVKEIAYAVRDELLTAHGVGRTPTLWPASGIG